MAPAYNLAGARRRIVIIGTRHGRNRTINRNAMNRQEVPAADNTATGR